jgi:hypothetical protein
VERLQLTIQDASKDLDVLIHRVVVVIPDFLEDDPHPFAFRRRLSIQGSPRENEDKQSEQ